MTGGRLERREPSLTCNLQMTQFPSTEVKGRERFIGLWAGRRPFISSDYLSLTYGCNHVSVSCSLPPCLAFFSQTLQEKTVAFEVIGMRRPHFCSCIYNWFKGRNIEVLLVFHGPVVSFLQEHFLHLSTNWINCQHFVSIFNIYSINVGDFF